MRAAPLFGRSWSLLRCRRLSAPPWLHQGHWQLHSTGLFLLRPEPRLPPLFRVLTPRAASACCILTVAGFLRRLYGPTEPMDGTTAPLPSPGTGSRAASASPVPRRRAPPWGAAPLRRWSASRPPQPRRARQQVPGVALVLPHPFPKFGEPLLGRPAVKVHGKGREPAPGRERQNRGHGPLVHRWRTKLLTTTPSSRKS